MSNSSPFGGRGQSLFPTLPRGEVVATYETYEAAQGAVDTLAKADFPVKQLSIVGNDLKSVERVTGKLTWGRVAVAGAASGAWLGIFFGLLFFIFSPAGAGLPFLLAAVLIGAGFGMLFGLVSYGLNRRRRDFTSTMQVIATNYQVVVEGSLVNRARNALAGRGEDASAATVTPHPSDPPRAAVPPVEPPASEPTHPSQPGQAGGGATAAPDGTTPQTPLAPPAYGERPPTAQP